MSAVKDVGGIVIDDYTAVTVTGRQRIARLRDAAHRRLGPRDGVSRVLDVALARDEDAVDLPHCEDDDDRRVLAEVLHDLRNGDDGSGSRAARHLLSMPKESRECPFCGGTGEAD